MKNFIAALLILIFLTLAAILTNAGNINGWIVANFFPGSWTLFSSTKLGKWYNNNGFYKYDIGQRLRLKSRNIVGYGVDPTGIVIGYEDGGEFWGDFYVIEIERYKDINWFEWVETGEIPEGSQKEKQIEKHFKHNIEYEFVEY